MSRFSAHHFHFLCVCLALLLLNVAAMAHCQLAIPPTKAVALSGARVELPKDLSGVTVVIVGFTRASADATTAWEIPVRTKLASDRVKLYDLAVLERVPGFVRGWVLHSLRSQVPTFLQPQFLPVFQNEAEWKRACGFDAKAPDAAYVLLTTREGKVLWKTHEPYSADNFERLKAQTGS